MQVSKVSKQPLTNLNKLTNEYITASGYDGRVMLFNVEHQEMELALEFTMESEFCPILSMCSFYTVHQPYTVLLNELNQLRILKPLQYLSKKDDTISLQLNDKNNLQRAPKVPDVAMKVQLNFDALSLAQYSQQELLIGTKQSIQLFDLDGQQSVRALPAPAPCTTFNTLKSGLVLGGFMDRSVRLYDIRRPDPVVRTFKGHKSHVVALRPHWENENRFTTCEVAGKALVWDLRATIPYHQIDVYDYSMDRRSD